MNISLKNRCVAGRYLASALDHYRHRNDVVVLAIPRGGVPIAKIIAQHLHAALDVIVVRKLGCPFHPELAFGAIASGGKRYLIQDIINRYRLSDSAMKHVIAREEKELERREQCYRGNKPPPVLKNKVVIIVDDGLATGATVRTAIDAVREEAPASIVVAVPVAASQTAIALRQYVDEVVCLATPEPFIAVGQHYKNFDQVSDQEVCDLLKA